MKVLSTFIFSCISIAVSSQVITGNLNLLKNTEIKLEGFNGLKSYPISETKIDHEGNFTLKYTANDYGVGYLMASDNKPLYVILSGENIEVVGEALSFVESIKITKGRENKWFEQYAKEHPKREQALSAWLYLEKMYFNDSLFKVQKKPIEAIELEKKTH